ncbi:hypothetical protein, partial [Nocardia sp. NPDC005366]|uniref:hypothetical protein n=1 Tax=Nocardia sp. NPDC005366 TaxID=3156878 RepID=UPI0033B16FE7
MNSISRPAVVAAALHQVFAGSPHAADSLEMWLAVTAEATHHLTTPVDTGALQWISVFTYYDQMRIWAEYHPVTAAVRITSGPLSGVTYFDPDSACRAIVAVYSTPGPDPEDADLDGDSDGDGDDMAELMALLPKWRLGADHVAVAPTGPADHDRRRSYGPVFRRWSNGCPIRWCDRCILCDFRFH